MSDKIGVYARRPGRRDFLTIGAAAAAVVAGLGKAVAAPSGNDDELLAMIAEEDRLRDIVDALETRGRDLLKAAPPEIPIDFYNLTTDQLPEPLASIYGESERHEEAAEKLAFRIEATIPKTIAGVIALIEFSGAKYENSAVENALTGLRQIAAEGGRANG